MNVEVEHALAFGCINEHFLSIFTWFHWYIDIDSQIVRPLKLLSCTFERVARMLHQRLRVVKLDLIFLFIKCLLLNVEVPEEEERILGFAVVHVSGNVTFFNAEVEFTFEVLCHNIFWFG